jgi:hypothetical protein
MGAGRHKYDFVVYYSSTIRSFVKNKDLYRQIAARSQAGMAMELPAGKKTDFTY